MKHLQSQYRHLRTVHKYHFWLAHETEDLPFKNLHWDVADSLQQSLERLESLIQALQSEPQESTR